MKNVLVNIHPPIPKFPHRDMAFSSFRLLDPRCMSTSSYGSNELAISYEKLRDFTHQNGTTKKKPRALQPLRSTMVMQWL